VLIGTNLRGLMGYIENALHEFLEATRVVTVREPVVMRSPEALRSCEPAPAVPGPEATNGQIAAFILELFAAGDDCRATLAELVAWEEEAAARTAP
jgi:hypothetical protein